MAKTDPAGALGGGPSVSVEYRRYKYRCQHCGSGSDDVDFAHPEGRQQVEMGFVIVVVVVLAAFLVVNVVHTTSKETRVGIKEDLTEIKDQLEVDLNELAERIEAKIAEAGTPVDVSAELAALRAVGARMDATLATVPEPVPVPTPEPTPDPSA